MPLDPDSIVKSLIVQSNVYSENPSFYREIIEGIRKGSIYTDPEKAIISGVLEACIKGSIDPWDVDLASFAGIMYSMISDDFHDFYFAGKVMSDAWRILRIKTMPDEREEALEDEPDDSVNPVTINEVALEIVPAVKHYETRKYMLIELLDTLKETMSRKPKTNTGEKTAVDYGERKLNSEDPGRDMDLVYQKIIRSPGNEIRMEDIWGSSREENSTFFIYSLFLMRDSRILLRQEAFGSPIFIIKNFQ